MKKASITSSSEEHASKQRRARMAGQSRTAKGRPSQHDSATYISPATAELIEKAHPMTHKPYAKSAFTEDKRATARHEHTNHFTNRAPAQGKK